MTRVIPPEKSICQKNLFQAVKFPAEFGLIITTQSPDIVHYEMTEGYRVVVPSLMSSLINLNKSVPLLNKH